MKSVLRAAVILVALVVSGWLLVHWAYPPLRCGKALTELTRRTSLAAESASDYERLSRLRRNLEDLAAIEQQCRLDVRLYMLAAANEEMLGRDADAIQSYNKALTIDRRPEIYSAIGFAMIRLGRIDEAVDMYVRAAHFMYPADIDIPSEVVAKRVQETVRAER